MTKKTEKPVAKTRSRKPSVAKPKPVTVEPVAPVAAEPVDDYAYARGKNNWTHTQPKRFRYTSVLANRYRADIVKTAGFAKHLVAYLHSTSPTGEGFLKSKYMVKAINVAFTKHQDILQSAYTDAIEEERRDGMGTSPVVAPDNLLSVSWARTQRDNLVRNKRKSLKLPVVKVVKTEAQRQLNDRQIAETAGDPAAWAIGKVLPDWTDSTSGSTGRPGMDVSDV
jgi:hypothetical protein